MASSVQNGENGRKNKVRVAFIGNSMLYYNDIPRLLERLSEDTIEQSSCLRGGTSLSEILVKGNGMYKRYNTPNAFIGNDNEGRPLHDFGDCTVRQLLFGTDPDLELQVYHNNGEGFCSCTRAFIKMIMSNKGYLEDDGTNPGLQQRSYYDYLKGKHLAEGVPLHWEYIVLNDFSRSPGQLHLRNETLKILESTYLPWISETNAVPIFMETHAYFTDSALDLPALAQSEQDIPLFTFKTCQGYTEYANLLRSHLPELQQPRIAPVGLAFLVVWEEDRDLWRKLFDKDRLHASPLGTFLTACIVHYTLFGHLPKETTCLLLDDNNDDMSELWSRARLMRKTHLPQNPFPTKSEARYLYHVARRVAVDGHRPSSFMQCWNSDRKQDDSRATGQA